MYVEYTKNKKKNSRQIGFSETSAGSHFNDRIYS